MAVKVYDDEYQIGYLCMEFLRKGKSGKPFTKGTGDIVRCRRPRGHSGEHQNKTAGWKWWFSPRDICHVLPIESEGEADS